MARVTWETASDGTPGYVNIIWMIASSTATIFYIVLMIKLYRNRTQSPFDSSYFMLWLNTGVADCLVVIANWAIYRLSGFQWLQYDALTQFTDNEMAIYNGLGIPLTTYLAIAGFFSLVVLSFNRFTSMRYPLKHTKVHK
jgi:hypothetical protein